MKIFGFLLDTESRFGKLMTKIGILVVANILFLLSAAPIITAGAAYSALYFVIFKMLKTSSDINPFLSFWEGFKRNFKQATQAWLIIIGLLIMTTFDIGWCQSVGGIFDYLVIVWEVIRFVILVFALHLFPLISVFENSLLNQFKSVIFVLMTDPLKSLLVIAGTSVPLALTYLDQYNQGIYTFIWFFIGFSLVTLWSAFFLLKVYSPYLNQTDK